MVVAVTEGNGLKADLRWPNDVLLGGLKLSGILTEFNAEITRVRYVGVGMGKNVNQLQVPPELTRTATSRRRQIFQRLPGS